VLPAIQHCDQWISSLPSKRKSISDAKAGLFESSLRNQGMQAKYQGGAAELAGSRRVSLSATRSMLGKCFTFSRLQEIDATVSLIIGFRIQELESFHSMDRFHRISLARLTPQALLITNRSSLHQMHECLLLGHEELAPIAL
jgi:hypothetical protein